MKNMHKEDDEANRRKILSELVLVEGKVLDRVFVKHQLHAINYYYHMHFVKNRTFFGLTDPFVISRIQIDKKQAKELKQASVEAQDELDKELEPLLKEIVDIKKKHLNKVLKTLTPEQRKSYIEKFGIR